MHKYYKICKDIQIVQTASAQIPWSHNMIIFDKIGVSSYEIQKYLPSEEEINLHIGMK